MAILTRYTHVIAARITSIISLNQRPSMTVIPASIEQRPTVSGLKSAHVKPTPVEIRTSARAVLLSHFIAVVKARKTGNSIRSSSKIPKNEQRSIITTVITATVKKRLLLNFTIRSFTKAGRPPHASSTLKHPPRRSSSAIIW